MKGPKSNNLYPLHGILAEVNYGKDKDMDIRSLAAARERLRLEGWSLVVTTREGESHVSRERGVMPLLKLLDQQGEGLRGAVLADKVIGRAAALLSVLAGFARIHAQVMSEPAREVLDAHGVPAGWDRLVPGIRNRNNDGPCPMEALTMDIDDPAKALRRIRDTINPA